MAGGIGIDPALTSTGIVHVEDGVVRDKRLIKSKKTGGRPIDETERLSFIVEQVSETVSSMLRGSSKWTLVSIEGLAFTPKSTLVLTQLAGLHHMIRAALVDLDVRGTLVVAPSSLKKFVTGKGNCAKDLMFLATYKRYGEEFSDDNLCDAHGLARIAEAVAEGRTEGLIRPQLEVIELVSGQL